MGLVSGHVEADSRGPHVFFAASDGETGKEATGWDLAAGRGRESFEGGGESGHAGIHQQAPIDSVTVGGPLAHIRSLHVGDGVIG